MEKTLDEPLDQKVFTISSHGEGAIPTEGEVVKVVVVLDGKQETLQLKNGN